MRLAPLRVDWNNYLASKFKLLELFLNFVLLTPYQTYFTLNAELFIARKITFSTENQKQISGPIVNIAVFGIALGLAVMILSAGIIKTTNNIQAIVLKGVDSKHDWTFLQKCLIKGSVPTFQDTVKSNLILISEYIANLLQLNVDDNLTVYFVQDPPRMRQFEVCGIYKTSIEDFDKSFALVDMRHLQKLNNWTDDQISGYEILIYDFKNLDMQTDSIFEIAGYHFTEDGSKLKITNIKQRYPQIFDWLNLQDINVWIILTLMLLVAGFNMISGLLILILERTNMIGLLKGLGYNNNN